MRKKSNWRIFRTLFFKEMKEERRWFIFFTVALLLLDVFLFSRINVWDKGAPTILSLFFPLAAILFLSIFRGFYAFREEWHQNTHHFLMTVPARGYILVFSKFLPILVEVISMSFLTLILSFVIYGLDLKDLVGIRPGTWWRFWIVFVMIAVPFSSFSILSYLVGRTFRRFRGLWVAFSYISIYVFLQKTSSLGAKLFSFIPRMSIVVEPFYESGVGFEKGFISQGLYYYLFLGFIVLVIASIILDKWVEI